MDMTTFVLAKNYTDKQIEKAEMGDIELDNTLTKQGFAADAKAVGDKLNSIKIPTIDSTLSIEGAAADAKTVGEALKNIDIPEQVQANWEQMDESAPDYIKNKTHYDSLINITIAEPQTVTYGYDEMDGSIWGLFGIPELDCVNGYEITLGDKIVIITDNTEHVGFIKQGNGQKWDEKQEDYVDYGYYYADCGDYIAEFNQSTVSVKCNKPLPDNGYEEFSVIMSILKSSGEIKKLDNKFIDVADSVDESDERPISSRAVAEARTHYEYKKVINYVPESSVEFICDEMNDEVYVNLPNPESIPDAGSVVDVSIQLDNDYMDRSITGSASVVEGNEYNYINIDYYIIRFYEDSIRINFDIGNSNCMNFGTDSGLVHISSIQTTLKKIDQRFLDIADSINEDDDRPVSSSAVAKSVSSPDWEQNDPKGAGYIKNRTHWSAGGSARFIPYQQITFTRDGMGGWQRNSIEHIYGIPEIGDVLCIENEWGSTATEVKEYISYDEFDEIMNRYRYVSYMWGNSEYYRIRFEEDCVIIYIRNAPTGDSEEHSVFLGLSTYEDMIKKLDNKFLDIADSVTADDNRPITSAAVQAALDNFEGASAQPDWEQIDSTSSDFIKNKPFGIIQNDPILDVELGWTVQDTEDGMGSERFWNTTTIANDGIRTPIQPGQYLVSFFNQSAVVELTESSGTIETDFITLSYYLDRWSNSTKYTVISEPPTWESGSSQLVIAPVEIKKIDSMYLDLGSTQPDWAQTDSTNPDYIKNKPFGSELGENYCEQTLSWSEEYSDEDMSYVSQWDNNTFSVYKWFNPGYYQIEFNEQAAIVKAENGIIQTDFIALSYSGDGMDGFTFTVISRPPDGQDSAVLTITPVNIIKLDPTYLPTPIANWSQSDENGIGYIQNRTHWDEAFGESEQIIYKLGDYSYDDMGEARYEKFTEAEINTSIGNYMYIFKTTTSTWGPEDDLLMRGGKNIRSYYYDDGMNSGYAITYNGVEYKDYIDTMTFTDGITGLQISRAEILSEVKQLDEKFIPDTIARVTELEALISDMYYKPGDSVSVRITTGGVLTAGGETVWFTIPLCKPRKNIQSISVNADYSCLIRQDGNYLLGSATEYAQASSIGFDLSSPDFILANLKFDTVPEGAVNNDTVGVTFYATLTFA